jgi:hypothetical protein
MEIWLKEIRLALMLVTTSIAGCSNWSPQGAHGPEDVVRDGDIGPSRSASAIILMDPTLLTSQLTRNAEKFAGSGCDVTFQLYPELYFQAWQKAQGAFSQVAMGTSSTSTKGYDVVITPMIDDVLWASDSWSSNLAATKIRFVTQVGVHRSTFESYQVAAARGATKQGCPSTSALAIQAAKTSLGLSVNRILKEMPPINNGFASKTRVTPPAEQAALLASLQTMRVTAENGSGGSSNSSAIDGIALGLALGASAGSGTTSGSAVVIQQLAAQIGESSSTTNQGLNSNSSGVDVVSNTLTQAFSNGRNGAAFEAQMAKYNSVMRTAERMDARNATAGQTQVNDVSSARAPSSSTGHSEMFTKAESKAFNFNPGNCPEDYKKVVPYISYPQLVNNPAAISSRLRDEARKAGSYDAAIDLGEQQLAAFRQKVSEAEQTAEQSWGGAAPLYDISACPQVEGIYCSAVHAIWGFSDAIVMEQYAIAGYKCHKASGTSL